MTGPVFHIFFDPVGASIILLVLLLVAIGLVLLTSWYWRRRLSRSFVLASDTNKHQMEMLLDRLPQGLLLADQQRHILWCNLEARRLLSLDCASPRLEGDLLAVVERVSESHKSELHELQPTADVKLQLRATPLAESSLAKDKVICIVTDVSERRHQEEFYRNFIQNISHELLTPLAAIAGHVANIKECSIEEVEGWRHSQEIIEQEVRRLTGLTSNLLLLSRLESGIPLRLVPTNIGVVVEQVVSERIGLAQAKAIKLSIQGPPRLHRIPADRDRIKQVFINLLDNAIKYCPEGSEVQVRLQTDEERIIVEVADDGPGIPEEDLPHVFEKMYRVGKERTRAAKGSGLGLSIVSKIVELHGGQITVESTVGQGTNFRVWLPMGQGNLL